LPDSRLVFIQGVAPTRTSSISNRSFADSWRCGYQLIATDGTFSRHIRNLDLQCENRKQSAAGQPALSVDAMKEGRIAMMINTPTRAAPRFVLDSAHRP